MRTIGIKNDWKNRLGHFSISVLAPDEPFSWEQRSYAFMQEGDKVYFLMGGQVKDKRLAGQAETEEGRIRKAVAYLEGWLKECYAIGILESRHNLKIHSDDPRGIGYFALQVWVWDKDKKRQHKPFHFYYENTSLYYLGYDERPLRELVKFVYKDKQTNSQKEIGVSPRNKDEAIYDAIDYLEWLLADSQFCI